ncbi:hypothetical protein AAG906_035588 [Vitis piasezkii]
MKWFGQAVLQVESYNMDVILIPFFESLAKKPPATMDDLFKQADKYSMLEDEVRAASQQVLVTNRPTKNNEARSSKPLNQSRQPSKLLPIICDLSYFKSPKPIKTNPAKRDWNRSLHYLVEKLIKVRYLKEYIRTTGRPKKAVQEATIQAPTSPTAPKVVINYIHRGLVDNKHSFKRQRYPSPKTRVIPSTYHQMVSYLTEEGQVDLLGNSLRHAGDSFAYPLTDLMFHLPRGLSGKRSSISIWTGRKSSRKKLTNDWQSDLSEMSSIWIVYIDIVVKSETRVEHCAFGVNVRKFLRFMVTQRGIEVNPAQVKVGLKTIALNNKKELQHLTGCLVALGHFITHFIDKLRPFFLTLRGASTFDSLT